MGHQSVVLFMAGRVIFVDMTERTTLEIKPIPLNIRLPLCEGSTSEPSPAECAHCSETLMAPVYVSLTSA